MNWGLIFILALFIFLMYKLGHFIGYHDCLLKSTKIVDDMVKMAKDLKDLSDKSVQEVKDSINSLK